ncbi:hypothetical protein KR074_004851 [Drosophila pseudoananassae]|nr:hypothetical protein KR074_004851 [Drosophila pseudoananassae]
MRHIWLLLLIACGSIHFPGVLTLPEAHPAKSSAAAGGGNGGGAGGGAGGGGGASAQTSGEPASELGDYDEEEPQKAPGNLAKSTPTPKLPAPFFNQKAVDVYVPGNATSVKLECPVKNYDPDRHVILWYKDDNQLSNGEKLMNNYNYTLDSQFSLTVPLKSNATELRFSCSVMPQKVRRQITIRFGPEPSTPAPAVDPSTDATPPPAHDSATDFRRDMGLWPAAALLLAAIQVAGQALY